MSIVEKINSADDLKKLSYNDLNRLCSEIRNIIVEVVSKNGGHLASSLGAVELIVAIHKAFDLSRDRFIFDVGHQCYAHKILTGRLTRFDTIRQYGGLSGFPKISESPYDAFGTGHSSTSISAAIGYAAGRDIKGESHYVGALIGDASLSSGMAFEALNHLGHLRSRVMIILNDNEMSISPNVGALSLYLEKIRVGWVYNKVKEDIEALLKMIPIFGSNVAKFVERVKSSLKYLVVPGMLFEELGIKYLGPVDGHNIEQIVATIQNARDFNGPILIHAITKKGKGFSLAEAAPEKYHSGGLFCIETGESPKPKTPGYTDVFGDTIVKLAETDDRIVAITAAMCSGTGLDKFAEKFNNRFFDVGICEQHALTFAAGLSLAGMVPVIALYSTFSQRAFDQFIHDIALQNLHVVLCLDRAGLVGEDGPTHHGSFDLSMYRMVPNITLMAPSDEVELKNALYNATQKYNGPVVIRYPKGPIAKVIDENDLFSPDFKYEQLIEGSSRVIQKGEDIAFISAGRCLQDCIEAAKILKESHGVNVEIIDIRFIKPLDTKELKRIAGEFKAVITAEDNSLECGFGEAALKNLSQYGFNMNKFGSIGIPDKFVEHGANAKLRQIIKVDAGSIVEMALKIMKK